MFTKSSFSSFFKHVAALPKTSSLLVKALSVALVLLVTGLFVFPAAADGEALILPVGQAVQQSVSMSNLSRAYKFTARQNQSIFLLAVSQDYENAPSITISRDLTNENIASVKRAVSGMCLRIAPGTDAYTMNISADFSNGAEGIAGYGLMLMPGAPNEMNCPNDAMSALSDFTAMTSLLDTDGINVPVSLTGGTTVVVVPPGIDTTHSSCVAGPNVDVGVNVRALPNLTAPILGNIRVNATVPVLASIGGTNWLLVNERGNVGFSSGDVLSIAGICTSIPVISVTDNQVLPTSTTTDLGLQVNVDSSILNADVNATLNNNGLNVNADTSILDANASLNNNGLNINVDAPVVDTTANVSVNDNGINVGADTPSIQATVTVGGGSNNQGNVCINALGIHIAC
ncbi:MAG: SH3 domain-containing protein [Chloroflexi bacterium]|nr:SH3 domain-containing protein [Chloroflexota bacterium]